MTHMNHRYFPDRAVFVVVGCAALMLAACEGSVTQPGVPPDLKHSWEVAFNRGDADAVAALYSPSAELVMSGSAPTHGRTAIRAAIDSMVKSKVKVRIGAEQNVGSGDVAYVYGPYSVVDHEGGVVVDSGTFLEVWRRRAGHWEIDLDVNAAGTPVAAPAGNSGGAAH
jgi:uncharacterized protein (TIGR02246 family)